MGQDFIGIYLFLLLVWFVLFYLYNPNIALIFSGTKKDKPEVTVKNVIVKSISVNMARNVMFALFFPTGLSSHSSCILVIENTGT